MKIAVVFLDCQTGHRHNAGTFPFVQLTRDLLRVGDTEGDALPIATLEDGRWIVEAQRVYVERWNPGYSDVILEPVEE